MSFGARHRGGPLLRGVLLRRYQRFLADVRLDEGGEVITAHTPNTGSMLGCSDPGSVAYVSRAANPARRLPFTLEIVQSGSTLVGVNTQLPNRLIHDAVAAGAVPQLLGYDALRREVPYGRGSRLDLLLTAAGGECCYVEIKNVTLAVDGVARFPDAPTERGRRHLAELASVAGRGLRAVILFLVQRIDCDSLRPADGIDPDYGEALRGAVWGGVEPLCLQARVTPERIALARQLPVEL